MNVANLPPNFIEGNSLMAVISLWTAEVLIIVIASSLEFRWLKMTGDRRSLWSFLQKPPFEDWQKLTTPSSDPRLDQHRVRVLRWKLVTTATTLIAFVATILILMFVDA